MSSPRRAVLTLSVLLLAALAAEPEYELAPGEELVTEGPGYRVKLELETAGGYNGSLVVHAQKEWAPFAADRFLALVRSGHYDGEKLILVAGSELQLGVYTPDPTTQQRRILERIKPEEGGSPRSNTVGRVAFVPELPAEKIKDYAKLDLPTIGNQNGGNTRIMVHLADNAAKYDGAGMRPFGQLEFGGLAALRRAHSPMAMVEDADGSGEGSFAKRVDMARVSTEGNAYLDAEFPELSTIVRATVIETWRERKYAYTALGAAQRQDL